jgi:hypothetical protein
MLGDASPSENYFIISVFLSVDFFFLSRPRLVTPPVFAVVEKCIDNFQGVMIVESFLVEVEKG